MTTGCERDPIIILKPVDRNIHEEPCTHQTTPLYLSGPLTHGWVAGLKNCLPFSASATLFHPDTTRSYFEIQFETSRLQPINIFESIWIETEAWSATIPSQPDTSWIPLSPDEDDRRYYYYRDNAYSTQTGRGYILDESYYFNQVYIQSVNEINEEVLGWIEMRFVKEITDDGAPFPDTITFTECYFLVDKL